MFTSAVKKSYSITSSLAPVTADDLMVDFVDYRDSIQRLNQILKQLEPEGLYATALWRMIFAAERDVLKSINSEFLHSALAWNRRTNLPSHPTLIADLQKYIEIFKPASWKKAQLQSFVDWARLGRQTIKCACGRGFKTRPVTVDFILRTRLWVEDNSLVMKQMVGVKTNDVAHLSRHYNPTSKSTDSHVIVFESESEVSQTTAPNTATEDVLKITNVFQRSAKQFKADKFAQMMAHFLT